MKLLNLDELVEVRREVTIGGVSYKVVDQTVGQMIDALQMAKSLDDNRENTEFLLSTMISTAQRLLPDCPREVIERLKMKQLAALIEFASASDEEAVERSEVEPVSESNLSEKSTP